MPTQRGAATGDHAGTAFEAAVMLDVDQAVVAKRVDARRADPGAQFQLALAFANGLIDADVTLGINLVGVDTEFGFDINGHGASFSQSFAALLGGFHVGQIFLPRGGRRYSFSRLGF